MLIESYQTVYVKMKKPLRNVSKRFLVEIVGVEPPFFRVHLDLLTT